MQFERCERLHCGGWMKEIVTPDNGIEKICAKCSRSPNLRYEKKIEQGKLRHTEFDMLFKSMWREKAHTYRIQKKLFTKERKV